ncbi:LysR family transcriptional regulator [Photobacterium sp. DNB23_23_1]
MNKGISIRQLETFRAVMNTGSITRASKSLSRTQPAVSSMINSLETELGLELFQRDKGRLIPTPEAHYLLEEAEVILERLTRTTQLMAEVKDLKKGKLRVACMPAVALFFMPHLITRYVKDKPELEVTMMMRSSRIVQDWIASQQYDIGYCELPKNTDLYNVEPIKLKGVCAIHKDHQLAKKSTITPKDLDGFPLVSLFNQHPDNDKIRRIFDENNANYRPRFELQNYISGFEFVEQQLCACICDPISAASYNLYKSGTGNILFIPFSPLVTFEHAILTPAHKPMSQTAKAFAQMILEGVDRFAYMEENAIEKSSDS